MADSPEKKEFKRRFKAAEEAKSCILNDVREVYRYCLDGKADDPLARQGQDTGEVFSSLPADLAEDFASDLATYFMPEYAEWVNYGIGNEIAADFEREANEAIEQRKAAMQTALAASNLYGSINTIFLDAAHGTIGCWMHDMGTALPIRFEPIHFSQLFINVGRYGELDDRFRQRSVTWDYLFDTWPKLKEKEAFKGHLKSPHDSKGKLVEGFWQDKDERSGRWKRIVAVEDEVVEYETLGSVAEVPLLSGRFRPSPSRPWGFGPARRVLPDIRTHNELSYMGMDNIDRSSNPAFASVGNTMGTDWSEGIIGGTVYDLPPGASLSKLDIAGSLDTSFFSQDKYEERLHRGFYQDGPRQRGLTPPSATQWLDEARRIQKRLGRPAGPIFSEFVTHLIKRTDYLLSKYGKLAKDVLFDGRMITLEPINPLTYAQRQEEVVVARSLLNDIFTFDPQGASALVDTSATFAKMQSTLGDRLVKVRSADEVAQIQQQQAAAMQAAMPQGDPNAQ